MEVTWKVVLWAVLAICCSYVRADEEEDKAIDSKPSQKEKFFLASYFTTTFISLSTFTSSQYYVCVQTSKAATACTGRRRRRRNRLIDVNEVSADTVALDMSEGQNANPLVPSDKQEPLGSEKFLFTVWRTTTSIATITSTSTNFSITISISAACTHGAFGKLPLCK